MTNKSAIGRVSILTTAAGMLLAMVPHCLAANATSDAISDATADALATLPGFQIELVLRADKQKHGSWISLAKDRRGRLLLGGQRGEPITRLTIDNGKIVADEDLKMPLSEVMGMLDAFDCLYVNGGGKNNKGETVFGLFRCRDSKGDGHYDQIELLHTWPRGTGDHGAHTILLGADKKLYIVIGNHTEFAREAAPTSPHRNYADDVVLPRAEDFRGPSGLKPPGGSVVRMNPDGTNAELFAAGERNCYSVAFNADGELFGFDSDPEGDWGSPWYRPIRVFHAVSAAEHGFREGTAKWPEYYPDSLPAVVNIGIGSPTGVAFGYGAKFPARFQKALFILDWTYGRVMAVHPKPDGAGYGGTFENFVWPKAMHTNAVKTPNNLTGVVVGDDGALYLSTGGRNTQGYLYRVKYAGNEPTTPLDPHDADGATARELRHKLEAFHGHVDLLAVETAWPYLDSDDRYIRYAARIAIESQPVSQWQSRALGETKSRPALTALLALARYGDASSKPDLLAALGRFSLSSLPEPQQLEKLRVLEVSLSRAGKPKAELARQIVDELDPMYPAASDALNRELCQILLALDAPNAVSKSMKLLASATTQEQQVQYMLYLRTIRTGWTPQLRRDYFSWWNQDHSHAQHPPAMLKWFEQADRPYSNGPSYPGFIENFRKDALATLTPDEQSALQPILSAYKPLLQAPPKGPKKKKGQLALKNWTMADLEPLLPQVGKGRNFVEGRDAFLTAQCLACHRFGNEGGAAGPDLTAVASRFGRRDILESILEPSKVVSDQFANTDVRTKDGDIVNGRIVSETADMMVVQPNPLESDRVAIKKSQVKSSAPSKLSPMPEGLVNTLSKDELLDLLAYIESGGREDHPDFAK